jgi:hypothetical protein
MRARRGISMLSVLLDTMRERRDISMLSVLLVGGCGGCGGAGVEILTLEQVNKSTS